MNKVVPRHRDIGAHLCPGALIHLLDLCWSLSLFFWLEQAQDALNLKSYLKLVSCRNREGD